MTPEAELVIALCRTLPSDANKDSARSLVDAGVKWDMVRALAKRWKVEPVVAMHLRLGSAGSLASEIETWVRVWEREVRAAALSQASKLARVVSLLRAHEIEVLTIKGPALARAAYGDYSLRTSADIDLVVKPSDAMRAMSALSANGYGPDFQLQAVPRLIRGGHALTFYRDDDIVELHTALLPRHLSLAFSEHDIWNGTGELDCMGTRVRTPSQALHFVYLCAHAAKHRWSMLRWTCDIAHMGAAMSSSDVEETLSLAKAYRAQRILALALRVVGDTFGEDVLKFPGEARGRSDETSALARTAALYIEAGLEGEAAVSPRSLARVHPYMQALLYWLQCRERWIDRISTVAYFTFAPAPTDPAGRFAGALRPIRAVGRTLRSRQ